MAKSMSSDQFVYQFCELYGIPFLPYGQTSGDVKKYATIR